MLQGLGSHIYWLLSSFISWRGLFLFACTIILCAAWQMVQLARGRELAGGRSTFMHLVAVYIFLFYLMHIYRLTGLVGFVWWLRSPLISLDRIGIIPFATIGSIVPEILNVIMTIPFGFMLPSIWPEFRSLKKVILAGFLFSLTIETMQLFTFRFSTTGDLITNTLGAIIGYFIFAALFHLFSRKKGKEQRIRHGTRYEAVIYIALSLIGVIFFYHPSIVMRLSPPVVPTSSIEFEIGRELSEGMEYVLVVVTEISNNQIQGEVLRWLPTEAREDTTFLFSVSDATIVRVSTGHGQNHKFMSGTVGDILLSDLLDVFGYQEEGEFIAIEITITRD